MSLLTRWGYTLTEATALTDMLTTAEFNTFTANKYAGDSRIAAGITSVCASIRDYVGWHLYPSASCEMTALMNDKRVTRTNDDLLIQLPAGFVSAVTEVSIGGTTYTTFSFETNGILRVYNVDFSVLFRYSPIEIAFTAGATAEMLGGVKELIAHQVMHSIAIPVGITSEAAGGVSVTYSAKWTNTTRATDLSSSDREVLDPYRLKGVF